MLLPRRVTLVADVRALTVARALRRVAGDTIAACPISKTSSVSG
jgi:hypothetical protein